MKKLALILAVTATLSACSSNEGTVACEAATKEMMTAIEKAGNPQMTAMFKQQLETSKAAWSSISDQKALAAACKQTAETMKAAMAGMPK